MPPNENSVATIEQLRATRAVATESNSPSVRAGFFNAAGFELMQRVAKAFAASSLVPKDYQGNLPNCMIAINMAERIGADPMMVMQNLYIVHGRPGWSAQFLIATFNHCGRFTAIRYEWFGEKGKDSWGCRAYATEKESGEKIVGPDISIALSKAESWYDKTGSKWKTIPQLMLMYRAAAWMIRTYAPEIAMGLQTAEELGDTFDATRGDDGDYRVTTDALKDAGRVIDQTADAVDKTTGEVTKADDRPALSLGDDKPDYSVKASQEQRDAIIAIAKRNGLTVAQLDAKLVDKFTFGVDELPLGMVALATEFVGGLKG